MKNVDVGTGTTDVLTIQAAATLLGVWPMTARRWDGGGKVEARRHPINNYRVYTRKAVLRLREQIMTPTRG